MAVYSCSECDRLFSTAVDIEAHTCAGDKPAKPKRRELKARIAELEKLSQAQDNLLRSAVVARDVAVRRQRELESHIAEIAYENTALKAKVAGLEALLRR